MPERKLKHYLLKKWKDGAVLSSREFPPTPEGKRAAERVKKAYKKSKPGRKGQACTITPVYEDQ